MEVNSLPIFLNYEEEGRVDQGCEALQDFFISWTLRCAMEKFRKDNFLLNSYSKSILLALLFGYNIESEYCYENTDNETIKVKSVKTKRQLGGIDLIAEIEIENNGTIEHYILSIENKWYAKLGLNQLERYSEVVKANYDLTEKRLVQVLIYCDSEIHGKDKTILERCVKSGYKCTDIESLKVLIGMKEKGLTMNFMFDEYWFRT